MPFMEGPNSSQRHSTPSYQTMLAQRSADLGDRSQESVAHHSGSTRRSRLRGELHGGRSLWSQRHWFLRHVPRNASYGSPTVVVLSYRCRLQQGRVSRAPDLEQGARALSEPVVAGRSHLYGQPTDFRRVHARRWYPLLDRGDAVNAHGPLKKNQPTNRLHREQRMEYIYFT
jgi:hypothetical protein